MRDLKIGDLARRGGSSVATIRYYEAIGLLPPADRRAGGQRSYGEPDVARLLFIRRCRDIGFSIADVRTLAQVLHDPERVCTEARDLAQQHLAALRAKRAELRALERTIAGFVLRCDQACRGGPGSACVIGHALAAESACGGRPA